MSRYSILPHHTVGIMMLCYTINWLAGSTFSSEDRLKRKTNRRGNARQSQVGWTRLIGGSEGLRVAGIGGHRFIIVADPRKGHTEKPAPNRT